MVSATFNFAIDYIRIHKYSQMQLYLSEKNNTYTVTLAFSTEMERRKC